MAISRRRLIAATRSDRPSWLRVRPIPEQLQDLGRIGIDAEGNGGFDLQEAVTRQRLHGLLTANGRAEQNTPTG
jgi:hypothetical protein